MVTTWEHAKLEIQKFIKIRISLVGKQLKMCACSSLSRAQAVTSAYNYHMESPIQLIFPRNTWKSFKVGGSEGWCSSSCRYACCVAFLFSSMTVMAEKPQLSQSWIVATCSRIFSYNNSHVRKEKGLTTGLHTAAGTPPFTATNLKRLSGISWED